MNIDPIPEYVFFLEEYPERTSSAVGMRFRSYGKSKSYTIGQYLSDLTHSNWILDSLILVWTFDSTEVWK